MRHTHCLLAWVLLTFLPYVCPDPLRSTEFYARRTFPPNDWRDHSRPAEPRIAADISRTGPPPTQYDQIETAIYDALQLVMVVLTKIDKDNKIYPSYFSKRDKKKVKAVYQRLAGECNTGHVGLSNLIIQSSDVSSEYGGPLCDYYTQSAIAGTRDRNPKIIICPLGFKKKAYTTLRGATNPENNPDLYLR
ncbi:MAG: hypothetical protein Q9218_006928, partial [Villophora microphyllina]